MTSVSDPLVGQVLDGRYEILARLARGGMATVYRATDLRLTRTVAVKVMHDALGDDGDFVKKFDAEARAAATLSSPHVVSVFDQGMGQGRPYIVMEFVDGSTLRHVLSREAPMEPLRALELVESVVQAIAAAHDAGLVHRDVKPENVLISSRGQVKVADFGLARAITSQTATATAGLLIGTVSYMPPELVTKARADARGDVYSTGVMLFEMLTGTKPHQAETPIAVAWSHVHNDIPAPSTLLARSTDSRRIIPPYLDALVVACTRRQPAERPRDARELLALVRAARRALRKGIIDDPALTEAMLASTRHRHDGTDPTLPDAHLPETTAPSSSAGPLNDEPPRAVSWQPQDSGPITGDSGASGITRITRPRGQQSGSITVRAATPTSPVDYAAPGHGADYRMDLSSAKASVVPAPRPQRSPSRPVQRAASSSKSPAPARPRSPRTPIFPHMSHDPVHKRRRGLVALVALLILALLLGLFAYVYLTKLRWTTAPALAGGADQAITAAQSQGFVVVSTREYSETVPKGEVITTHPSGGDRLLKGGSITVVISDGPERYPMPTVVGLTVAQATPKLEQVQARLGTTSEQWSETVKVGIVVSASVKAGSLMKPDTAVNLVVSKGPKPIAITSWVGKSAQEATAALTKAGFALSSTQENSDTVPEGSVITQTPASGEGPKGTKVALVVSKGPVMVDVPSVTGVDEATARQRLTARGFKVTVTYNTPKWLRLNVVAAADPAANKQAPKGSTVTIFVS